MNNDTYLPKVDKLQELIDASGKCNLCKKITVFCIVSFFIDLNDNCLKNRCNDVPNDGSFNNYLNNVPSPTTESQDINGSLQLLQQAVDSVCDSINNTTSTALDGTTTNATTITTTTTTTTTTTKTMMTTIANYDHAATDNTFVADGNHYRDINGIGVYVEMMATTPPPSNHDNDLQNSFVPDNMTHHPVLITNAADVSDEFVSTIFFAHRSNTPVNYMFAFCFNRTSTVSIWIEQTLQL
ncbi:MAG: hypothetical protein ACRYE7_02270 [Janthinobacterium lividum]